MNTIEEQKQVNPRQECKNCPKEKVCEPFFKNYHKIPCARKKEYRHREFINSRALRCCHLRIATIDGRKYCVSCGEGVDQ